MRVPSIGGSVARDTRKIIHQSPKQLHHFTLQAKTCCPLLVKMAEDKANAATNDPMETAVDLGWLFQRKAEPHKRRGRLDLLRLVDQQEDDIHQVHAHHHVHKFLKIPMVDLEKIQVVKEGEGKNLLERMPYCKHNSSKNQLDLSLPILIEDTPESIGMKVR